MKDGIYLDTPGGSLRSGLDDIMQGLIEEFIEDEELDIDDTIGHLYK